jgi:hypothetical protein
MRLHIDGSVGIRRATTHFGHFPNESFHGLIQNVVPNNGAASDCGNLCTALYQEHTTQR